MEKLFFDGEFCDLRTDGIKFLSVAFVKESGESLYLEIEQPKDYCSPWVLENVFPHLSGIAITEEKAKEKILEFLDGRKYQIVADVCQFDWMGICRLFGGPFEIPFFYIPIDLSTVLFMKDVDIDIDREKLLQQLGIEIPGSKKKHNALYDAMVCMAIWNNFN